MENNMKSVEIIGIEDFINRYEEMNFFHISVESLKNIDRCSAYIFGDYVIGSLYVPDRQKLSDDYFKCGFCLNADNLVIADDSGKASEIFKSISKAQESVGMSSENVSAGRFLFDFLEFMTSKDTEFLDEYENSLSKMEDRVLNETSRVPAGFQNFISDSRKDLRHLKEYYRLLSEVIDVIEEGLAKMEDEASMQLFAYLGKKVGRLYSDTGEMAEYVLQIRDICRSKIAVKQNKIMQMLTIVTTIFMPLTVITGWYGMNFENMPELSWKFGYGVVALAAVLVIVVEIIIFKKKKWF